MVHFLATSQDLLYVAESGTYRIADLESTPVLSDPRNLGAHVLARENDDAWIGTMEGLFKWDGVAPEPQLKETIRHVTAIEGDNSRIWVAVDLSLSESSKSILYRVEGNTAIAEVEVEGIITTIEIADGKLWLGTLNSVFLVDEGGPRRIFHAPHRIIKEIVGAGSEIWLTTTDFRGYFFSYKLEYDRFEPIRIAGTISIVEHDSFAWLVALQTVYRYSMGEYEFIRTFPHLIKAMDSDSGEIVVVTSSEIYLGTDFSTLQSVWDNRSDKKELEISGISYSQERVWIWGQSGLFQFGTIQQGDSIKTFVLLSLVALLIVFWLWERRRQFTCMVSYSRKDKAFALRIHDRIEGLGFNCWLDQHDILLGENFLTAIYRAIQSSKMVLLCCSQNSLTSEWVQTEIDKARESRCDIIPLDLDGYIFECKDARANFLQTLHVADFTGWETDYAKFESTFGEVGRAVRARASK